MFDKLELVENRYEELTQMISDPEVIANQSEWQKLMKEHASIEEVVFKYREYKKVKQTYGRSKRNDARSRNERISRNRIL